MQDIAEINIYNYKLQPFELELINTISINNADISDIKIIKINNFYLAVWTENNNIKCLKFDYLNNTSLQSININNICNKFNLIQENNNIILACYCSDISNIKLVILDYDLNLLQINHAISTEPIVDTLDKNINIINTPGQVIIISFGNRKLAVVVSDNNIISGEILVDYESYDCVDMHYNINNGVIITLEKTNANTCFIEVLDILGTKIQKLTSKKFGNNTMIPHNLVYNNNTDNYLLFFNNKIQIIKYDSDLIEVGLCYANNALNTSTYVNTGTYHTSKLFYCYDNNFLCFSNDILYYVDNYQGAPSAFIGISNNKCNINDICNITIKGNIYETEAELPNNYIGSKLYLHNVNGVFPQNMTINKSGVFIGTCINKNKILIGI